MVLQCRSDIGPRILFIEEHGAVMRSDGRDSGAVFHILHPVPGGNREYAFRISPVEQCQQTAALFIGTQKTVRIFIGFNHLKHGQRPVFHDSVEGGGKRFQTLFQFRGQRAQISRSQRRGTSSSWSCWALPNREAIIRLLGFYGIALDEDRTMNRKTASNPNMESKQKPQFFFALRLLAVVPALSFNAIFNIF